MESSQRNNPPPPRKWKERENTKLVEALLHMVNKGAYKAEKGFKPGWSRSIEKILSKECPTSGLKAKPHIESRYKVLGRDFAVVHDMLAGTATSGFGIHPETGVLTASDDMWDAYLAVSTSCDHSCVC